MENKKYSIIYADPPWQYKAGRCLANKSLLDKDISFTYPTMTMEQIYNLPIKEILDDNCLLFLWVTSPKLVEGINTVTKWGFEYSTISFIWYKQKTNPGYYTLSECEICLVGRKGNIPTPRGSRNERQFLSEMRTEHSKKPDEIRKRIERMFPDQNKIELFARQKTDGWDAWGNEVESDIDLKTA